MRSAGSRRFPSRRSGAARDEPVGPDADRGEHADPESIARTIVLTKLTARARSRQELADALHDRSVPADVADRVLDRFTEVGLVDDTAFARGYVEARRASTGRSRRALAEELRRKGIDDETVAGTLADIDDDAEYEAARRLVDKKLRSTRTTDPQARWRQLVGLLARRGYGSEVAVRVVRDALAGQPGQREEVSGPVW